MGAQDRLSTDQLAALAPGDAVTIEFVRDFRRPKHVVGTVVRVVGSRIVVSCCSDRGVRYVHEFGRDGVRLGGGSRAELVAADAGSVTPERRRQERRVDCAYRAWARNRSDVGKLRDLQAAINGCFEGTVAPR